MPQQELSPLAGLAAVVAVAAFLLLVVGALWWVVHVWLFP